MKATFISKEANLVKFSIEFSAEEFESAQIKAYQGNKEKFVIDGFRKGKAPRKLIETHYGEDIFFEDAVNNMFSEAYPQAIKELDLEVIDRPTADFTDLVKGQGFTVTIEVPVYPEISVKDYMGVEIEKIDSVVTDADLDKAMEALQKRNARMNSVERPIQEGDTATIDYVGFVDEMQFDGGTAERYPLKIGSGQFIPGFEEQLIGVSAGESKDVVVTFPEEYHADHLAGKEAIFKCTVHEVKVEELPALDDDFAKDVSEFDTIEELKAEKRVELEKAAAANAEATMKDKMLIKVYDANDFEIPEVMVDDEVSALAQEFEYQIKYQGLTLEQYLEYIQKTKEDFMADIRPEAFKRLKSRMLVLAIADAEGITVSEEEVNAELQAVADQYKIDVEQVRTLMGEDNIKNFVKDIKLRNAVDLMYANAVIK